MRFRSMPAWNRTSPAYFFTESRWQSLVKQLQKEGKPIPPRPAGAPPAEPSRTGGAAGRSGGHAPLRHGWRRGARPQWQRRRRNIDGRLAGQNAGPRGRLALIGAGTYASNQSCAVSGTGVGEFFIRYTVAREICSLVQYKGFNCNRPPTKSSRSSLAPIHGDGGVIAIAPDGQLPGASIRRDVSRAAVEGGKIEVHIYNDEP